MDYDLEKSKRIQYMFDYSEFLIKNNQYDEKILNWQAENSLLLKPLGLDMVFLKKKMEEKNKKYYKYDSLMHQITCKYILFYLRSSGNTWEISAY